MQHAKLSEIKIGKNRQRREFDEDSISSLSSSIQHRGLLHPVVCRVNTEKQIELVAGERRLRAIQMLAELDIDFTHDDTLFLAGTLPIVYVNDLSDIELWEVELEENILRTDLTWQEKSMAVAQLHKLRTSQALEKSGTQTFRDTATELKGNFAHGAEISSVGDDLIISQNLDNPEVVKASSKKEAMKVIDKKARKEHRAKLAEDFNLEGVKHSLIHADSLTWMQAAPSAIFDCLITDPPYGVDANNFGSNFETEHEYQDDWQYFKTLAETLSQEAFRLLKDNSHAYIFCSFEGFLYLKGCMENIGFKVWTQPLIWSKGDGNAPWVNRGHKRTYECILYAMKGARDVNTVAPDVIFCGSVAKREHAAQKPVPLLVELMKRSMNPGESVFDPFAGSGSIFKAATEASMVATGIERSEDYFNLALTKLGE